MKRNLQALALAALLYGTQAAAADTPAGVDELQTIPAKETYADRHTGEAAKSPATKPFPLGSGEYEPISAKETYVDRHKNDPVKASGSAFPADNRATASE